MANYNSPIDVVTGNNYLMIGGGGRKIVVLSNMTVIIVSVLSNTIYIHAKPTGSNTFSQLCTVSGCTGWTSVASNGTDIGIIFNDSTNVYFVKIDTLTVTDTDQNANKVTLDTVVSFAAWYHTPCIEYNATTGWHCAWMCMVTGLTTVDNVRYTRSTDGVTWDSVTQVTNWNTAGYVAGGTSLAIRSDNNPIISYIIEDNTNYYVMAQYYNGSAWNTVGGNGMNVSAVAYGQYATCITVNGSNVYITWYGTDSTDNTVYNIHCIKSTDSGVNWANFGTSGHKVTTGNSYGQSEPSITTDASGNVYIYWHGVTASSGGKFNIRGIKYSGGAWGSIVEYTTGTTGFKPRPLLCDNYKKFTEAICVHENEVDVKLQLRGVYTDAELTGSSSASASTSLSYLLTTYLATASASASGNTALSNLILELQDIVTKIDWDSEDYLNYTDLNRIEGNITTILYLISFIKTTLTQTAITDRTNLIFEYADSINRIEQNILDIKDHLYEPPNWETPITDWTSGERPNYLDIRRWESNIQELYDMVKNIINNLLMCGDENAICGEDSTFL